MPKAKFKIYVYFRFCKIPLITIQYLQTQKFKEPGKTKTADADRSITHMYMFLAKYWHSANQELLVVFRNYPFFVQIIVQAKVQLQG